MGIKNDLPAPKAQRDTSNTTSVLMYILTPKALHCVTVISDFLYAF